MPVTLDLEQLEYRPGYYTEPDVTRDRDATATTDADGRATAAITLPPGQSGSFRVTATAIENGRELTGPGVAVGAGLAGRPPSKTKAIGISSCWRIARATQPGESRELIVRGDTVIGPVLVTKEGQHVSWYRVLRPAAADAIEVPIDAGDVGDVFVNITYLREGRLYRAERRLGVPAVEQTLQRDGHRRPGGVEAAGSGRRSTWR